MEIREEKMDEEQLRKLSTLDLVKHALTEAKLLARAEILHAKHELREELAAAKTCGIMLGASFVLALVGLTLLFVALAMVLPISAWLSSLVLGGVLLLIAGGLAFKGVNGLPKKPFARTQERLKLDVSLTREELQ